MRHHCCETLSEQVHHEDQVVAYTPKLREYAIRVSDGGTSGIAVQFCPWCGTRLPLSLRDKWFDRLEELGIDPATDEVPHSFQADEWWLKREGKLGDEEKTCQPSE